MLLKYRQPGVSLDQRMLKIMGIFASKFPRHNGHWQCVFCKATKTHAPRCMFFKIYAELQARIERSRASNKKYNFKLKI